MAKQTINIGASPNDGTGTPLRTAFDYTNQNFTEIYTALGGGVALPGATTQVIFNDGGTNLAGDAGLVYNKTTDALTIGGNVQAGSATITGDLTVDTSTLKVDSTNNRVGINTASPISGSSLDVRGAVGTGTDIQSLTLIDTSPLAINNGGGLSFGYVFQSPSTVIGRAGYIKTIKENATDGNYASAMVFGTTANAAPTTERYRIASDGVATWSNVGGVAGTAMTLNANGLGVGASPATRLHVSNTGDVYARIATTSVSKAGVQLSANGVVRSHLLYDDGAGTTYLSSGTVFGGSGQALVIQSGTSLGFYTNNQLATANMTLDASGNLLVGVASAVASGSTFENLGTARQVLTLKGNDATSYTLGLWSATTTGDNFFAYFGTEASTTVRGSVTYNRAGGLVAYNTTSDYRAKDIIGPVSNSGSLIDSLKVYVGKMHGATIERPMLVAHEAQEVAPYAVSGTKDEVDAEGKPKYQQMDASALVPLLIAEIQSLRARVQTLEAR